jgi:hypothetical protein
MRSGWRFWAAQRRGCLALVPDRTPGPVDGGAVQGDWSSGGWSVVPVSERASAEIARDSEPFAVRAVGRMGYATKRFVRRAFRWVSPGLSMKPVLMTDRVSVGGSSIALLSIGLLFAAPILAAPPRPLLAEIGRSSA